MIEQVPEINETIPNHCPTVLFWDGMGWDGMGWDGMGWDGMGWEHLFICIKFYLFSIQIIL
jgi:hypothetical protein